MLVFNFDEENIQNAIKSVISTMLPHQNYDGKFFTECVDSLKKLIDESEMPLHYRILCKIIYQFYDIVSAVGLDEGVSNLKITAESVDEYINTSIGDFVHSNKLECSKWMGANVESVNLDTLQGIQETMQHLGSAVIDLYDECFDLARDSSQIGIYKVTLVNAIRDNVVRASVVAQNQILTKGYQLKRKFYSGSEDCVAFSNMINAELNSRLTDKKMNLISLNDINTIKEVNNMNQEQSVVLGEWGIPSMDDMTPIFMKRYVVIVAEANIGKTAFCSGFLANQLTSAGTPCVYITGESSANTIKNNYQSNYIWRKYNAIVNPRGIAGMDPTTEEAKRLINLSDLEMAKEGLFHMQGAITYENAYQDLVNIYEQTGAKVYIIDHTKSMRSDPKSSHRFFNNKERLDNLSEQLRDFRTDYPVSVIVLSHPSIDCLKDLKQFGRVKPDTVTTRDSGAFQYDADDVLVFYKTEQMRVNHTLGVQIQKRRNAEIPSTDTILSIDYDKMDFHYDPQLQLDSNNTIEKEVAIDRIADSFNADLDSAGLGGYSVADFLDE